MKKHKEELFICGVCNGKGKIDDQKCIYCGDKGAYGPGPKV